MPQVLCISSQVVRGHVGLSASVPAFHALGFEVLAMPTIVLSNHPGHPRAAGARTEVNTLMSMLEVLDANGWLTGIDIVMTGYLPSAAHAGFARRAIDLVKRQSPNALITVDPVAGDDPRGLYIESDTAAEVKQQLVPRADLLTPNRFELSWLSESEVTDAASAIAAARKLGDAWVVAKSIPADGDRLANVSVAVGECAACHVTKRPRAPHGTGDLLAALLSGHFVLSGSRTKALASAVAAVDAAIIAAEGSSDLVLAAPPNASHWIAAAPVDVVELAKQ